jgi:menaquinone-dependent protoporphyrinogen oxidase
MKVLVTYASKYGSTKGIADFMGEKLRQRGMEPDVLDIGGVRNIGDYQAFVIGSAVYMGHWMKEARQFVSKNSSLLVTRPVWLFSSGPVGPKATDAKGRDLLEVSGPAELDELRALVKPQDHRVFFGALDGSRLSGLIGWGFRMAQKSKSARESMPDGDFRDWGKIGAWANNIAETLTVQGPEVSQVNEILGEIV